MFHIGYPLESEASGVEMRFVSTLQRNPMGLAGSTIRRCAQMMLDRIAEPDAMK